MRDVEWLYDRDIVLPLELPQEFAVPYDLLPLVNAVMADAGARTLVSQDEDVGQDLLLRIFTSALREREGVNCVAIARQMDMFRNFGAARGDVLQVIIKEMPVPDEGMSWEEIVAFRANEDVRASYLALRDWVNEISRLKLPLHEVEDKLSYLLSEYERHMKLQTQKLQKGIWETLVTVWADVLGDLISLKWGDAARALFSIRGKQISLIEEERRAPGRELAYVVRAREAFARS